MDTTTHRIDLGFATFLLRTDLVRSEAPIATNFDPEEEEESWSETGHQTADARHSLDGAIRLAIAGCGRDWYAAPNDDRDDDEILDELVSGAKVKVLP